MDSSVFREEFHLRADNEQEETGNGILCFVNISHAGIQTLKVNKSHKAVGFRSFLIPHSTNDGVWLEHLQATFNSPEFIAECQDCNCKYSLSSSKVILIPSALHTKEKARSNYEFVLGESVGIELLEINLSDADVVGIQGIPEELKGLIEHPISSSFLSFVNQLHAESAKMKAHLIIEEKEFALIIFKNSQMVLCNWFKTNSDEDVLFYLMASLETIKILHSEIEIELSGKIEKGDAVHTSLSKYLSKLSFRKRPKNLSYSYSFKEMPEHRCPFVFATACE